MVRFGIVGSYVQDIFMTSESMYINHGYTYTYMYGHTRTSTLVRPHVRPQVLRWRKMQLGSEHAIIFPYPTTVRYANAKSASHSECDSELTGIGLSAPICRR